MGISIGTELIIVDKNDFDGSLDLLIDGTRNLTISSVAATNISVILS